MISGASRIWIKKPSYTTREMQPTSYFLQLNSSDFTVNCLELCSQGLVPNG